MAINKDTFHGDIRDRMVKTWETFIENMENSLDILEKGLNEAAEMANICTSEWCQATEHVIDELSNSLFSISEPSWSSEEDSKKIKVLKRRVHDLYAKYKGTASLNPDDKKEVSDTLPYCTTAPSAEQARTQNDDEPCDDGRTGEFD